MANRPSKKGAQFFFTLITILGIVIVKKAKTENPSPQNLAWQVPDFLGAGLVLIGIAGIILIWAVSGKKPELKNVIKTPGKFADQPKQKPVRLEPVDIEQ